MKKSIALLILICSMPALCQDKGVLLEDLTWYEAEKALTPDTIVVIPVGAVAAFAARLKDSVDLDAVRDDLAGVVTRALEPAHASVWISRPG